MRASGAIFMVSFMLVYTCAEAYGHDNSYKAAPALVVAASAVPDTKPPETPGGLAVTNKTCTSVSLSWTASYDNTGVKGYQVYRDGKKIVSTTRTSYTNRDLVPGRKYAYAVKAYDAAGNLSESSATLNVTTISDVHPPKAPAALRASSSTCTSVTLTWEPSTDDTGVKGYEIYRNGSKIASTSATSYVRKGLTPGQSYSFHVRAYDIAGNYSEQSNGVFAATTPDTTAPSSPAGLKASSVAETEVSLTWTASSDNVKVKGYEIFCDGAIIGTTSKTSYTRKSLIPGKSYVYTVRALDLVGNKSAHSAPLKVTTSKDVQAPTAPTGLKVKSVNGSSVSLTWSPSTDNTKIQGYDIYCNGIKIATTTRTSRTVKNPTGLGVGVFWVKAYDLGNNWSASSNFVTVITP
jgi:chitodextrinase